MVARRLISGALGLKVPQKSKESFDEDENKLHDAKCMYELYSFYYCYSFIIIIIIIYLFIIFGFADYAHVFKYYSLN